MVVHLLGLTPMSAEEVQRARGRVLSNNTPGLGDNWSDKLKVDVNGVAIPDGRIRRVFHVDGRLEKFGRPLEPYTSIWFELDPEMVTIGNNNLGIELLRVGDGPAAEVAIEEVEVAVMPRPVI